MNFFQDILDATLRRDTRLRCIADNANSKISSHPPYDAISKISPIRLVTFALSSLQVARVIFARLH